MRFVLWFVGGLGLAAAAWEISLKVGDDAAGVVILISILAAVVFHKPR